MINDGFTNLQFHEELDKFEGRRNEQHNELLNINPINIYYNKNEMSPAYKVNTRVIKPIVKRNVKSKSDDDMVNLIVYKKNIRMSNLLMRNNIHAQSKLKSSNVAYEFKCSYEVCALRPHSFYIGYTQTIMS